MKKFYILVCAILFVVASVSAQEVATKEAESLETKHSKIEKRTATLEKLHQYLKVTGFIQGMYEWHDADREHSTNISSFSIRRARFSVTGDLYKGKNGAKID